MKSESIPSNLAESSGNWLRMSSDPIKILSKCDQVLCTSSQIPMTESAVDNFFCQEETSSRKCAIYFDVIRFCSWTCVQKLQVYTVMKIKIIYVNHVVTCVN